MRSLAYEPVQLHRRLTAKDRPTQRQQQFRRLLAWQDARQTPKLTMRRETLRGFGQEENGYGSLVSVPELAELGDTRSGIRVLRLTRLQGLDFKPCPVRRLREGKPGRLPRPYEEFWLHQSWNATRHVLSRYSSDGHGFVERGYAQLPAHQLRQSRRRGIAQGGEGRDGMAGFSRRMASRTRPTSTTSP